MAWPCMSRVCCLARLWSQLDGSDLAVPLPSRSYAELQEPEPEPEPEPEEAAAERPRPRPRAGGQLPAGPLAGQAGPRPPFAAESQYRRDFRAWPLPRPRPLPGPQPSPPASRPLPPPSPATTSYRQEYRPWTGAKPSKPIKTKQGFVIPEDHFVQETSYRADFKIPEAQTKFSPNPSAVFQAPSRILNV